MPDILPQKYRDLLSKQAFGYLATLMPDGRPQVTPVWCDDEGEYLLVNSAKGRRKDLNMRHDPRVAISIVDPEDPYRYVEIRGRVVDITEEGADAHIDRLAKKYLDLAKYPYRRPGEVRVIYRIKPEHAAGMG